MNYFRRIVLLMELFLKFLAPQSDSKEFLDKEPISGNEKDEIISIGLQLTSQVLNLPLKDLEKSQNSALSAHEKLDYKPPSLLVLLFQIADLSETLRADALRVIICLIRNSKRAQEIVSHDIDFIQDPIFWSINSNDPMTVSLSLRVVELICNDNPLAQQNATASAMTIFEKLSIGQTSNLLAEPFKHWTMLRILFYTIKNNSNLKICFFESGFFKHVIEVFEALRIASSTGSLRGDYRLEISTLLLLMEWCRNVPMILQFLISSDKLLNMYRLINGTVSESDIFLSGLFSLFTLDIIQQVSSANFIVPKGSQEISARTYLKVLVRDFIGFDGLKNKLNALSTSSEMIKVKENIELMNSETLGNNDEIEISRDLASLTIFGEDTYTLCRNLAYVSDSLLLELFTEDESKNHGISADSNTSKPNTYENLNKDIELLNLKSEVEKLKIEL